MITAFGVASHASPARVADTHAGVEWCLNALYAWFVTTVAHPALMAIHATHNRVVLKVALTSIMAVRFSRAVWYVARHAAPARVTSTHMVG